MARGNETEQVRMRLTQWLCAARHAVYAIPWDPSTDTAEHIVEVGEQLARDQLVHPWCGICGGAIAPEVSVTRFDNLGDLYVAMRTSQLEQLASRALLDAAGETFDVRQGRSAN